MFNVILVERWLPVSGTDGYYEVSSWGRIRSWKNARWGRRSSPVIMRQYVLPSGHLQVTTQANGLPTRFLVHRLVAAEFIGPCPTGMECCHNDGRPWNNFVFNIRYDTHKNNLSDRILHGTMNYGERNGNTLLTSDDVRSIKEFLAEGWTQRFVAKLFNINYRTVHQIHNGIRWRHLI